MDNSNKSDSRNGEECLDRSESREPIASHQIDSQSSPETTLESGSIDVKLVSDILTYINVSRKHSIMYPEGHPQLTASIEKVVELLERYFVDKEELTLGVTGESLLIEEVELPKGNRILQELSHTLHEHSIVSLTLQRGVTPEEILILDRLLAINPESVCDNGSAEAAAGTEGLRHIKLATLDLECLDYTDVDEIRVGEQDEDKSKGSHVGGGATWEDFARFVMDSEEHFTDLREGIRIARVDPEKLAEFLNRIGKKRGEDLSYEKVISYLLEDYEPEESTSKVMDTVVRKNFIDLFTNLNPDLRSEFLKETFKFSVKAPRAAAEILERMPDKLLQEALKDVVLEKSQIHPRVIQIIEKVASFDTAPAAADPTREESAFETKDQLVERIALLFTPSETVGATYIENFGKILEEVRGEVSGQDTQEIENTMKTDLDRQMEFISISDEYIRVLLDLMEQATKANEAFVYAHIITDCIKEQIALGRWELFSETWRELSGVRKFYEKTKPFVSEGCREAQEGLWTLENMILITSAIREYSKEEAMPLIEILRGAGQAAAEPLIMALAEEEDTSTRRILLNLVIELKEQALPFVIPMLSDQRWYVVRNMLHIIKQIGGKDSLKHIERLANHKHPKVRLEALQTLVHFASPAAAQLIITGIDDSDLEYSLRCIAFAGSIKNRAVTERLLSIVTSPGAQKIDLGFSHRQAAVRSLSQICDPAVLPELYRLVISRKLFNVKDLNRLRLEIFRSLGKYPLAAIRDFVEWGLKSDDIEIANISQVLRHKILREASNERDQ